MKHSLIRLVKPTSPKNNQPTSMVTQYTPPTRFTRHKKAILMVILIILASGLIASDAFASHTGSANHNIVNDPTEPIPETTPEPATILPLGVEEEPAEEQITVFISAVIGLLLIASLVGVATNRLRLPYTVGLVLIGLALSLRGQEQIEIPPEIFLGLLVPPLIFEAAFHIKFKDLLKDLTPILALAIPGVLITTLLVGGVVAWGTGFPLATALIFGALVAATDPVAVVALFRSLGVPKRLQVLMEGESLFNDGTAIVVFNLMLVIAATGEFKILGSMVDFGVVAGGWIRLGDNNCPSHSLHR